MPCGHGRRVWVECPRLSQYRLKVGRKNYILVVVLFAVVVYNRAEVMNHAERFLWRNAGGYI